MNYEIRELTNNIIAQPKTTLLYNTYCSWLIHTVVAYTIYADELASCMAPGF